MNHLINRLVSDVTALIGESMRLFKMAMLFFLASNYPPAEPGALFSVSRSKRLEGDADASPAHCAT